MDIPPWGTILTLVFFLGIGLVPVIPVVARYVIVVAAGLGIYFGMPAAFFNLPNGDNMAISALMGGNGGEPGFNKLSMGFLGGVIGVIFTTIGAVLQKVLGKKE